MAKTAKTDGVVCRFSAEQLREKPVTFNVGGTQLSGNFEAYDRRGSKVSIFIKYQSRGGSHPEYHELAQLEADKIKATSDGLTAFTVL